MDQLKFDELLGIPNLSDLVINGHQNVFAALDGAWVPQESPFSSAEDLRLFASNLANAAKHRLDYALPFADVAIGQFRYHIALPISGDRLHVSVRKHQTSHLPLSQALLDPNRWLSRLETLVASKANLIICGGTGSGKTTLLRAMLELAAGERIITVEDVPELELSNPNLVSLLTRQANTDGAGQIDLQRLVVESLRMKPDRIVIGEVRGLELVPMLQALNSGHRGSATTVHANHGEAVPARLIGIGLLGGLSPATTAHLAASAFDRVISLGPRVGGINITSIASFELTPESKLVTKIEY